MRVKYIVKILSITDGAHGIGQLSSLFNSSKLSARRRSITGTLDCQCIPLCPSSFCSCSLEYIEVPCRAIPVAFQPVFIRHSQYNFRHTILPTFKSPVAHLQGILVLLQFRIRTLRNRRKERSMSCAICYEILLLRGIRSESGILSRKSLPT